MKVKLVSKKEYAGLEKFRKNLDVSDGNGDICIAVGGDGTFLRAARSYDGPILPIRPNDTGTLGYFSDVTVNDADFVIESLKSKSYEVETLCKKVGLSYKGKTYYAVNEVSLHNVSDAIRFKIFRVRNGKKKLLFPFVTSGDGIIIASSIGSTAYNKSAGGPIALIPDLLCITFMLVDAPIKNSVVAGAKDEFEVEILKGRGTLRTDNEEVGTLDAGESFSVKYSDKPLRIVKFPAKREDFESKLERLVTSRLIKSVT